MDIGHLRQRRGADFGGATVFRIGIVEIRDDRIDADFEQMIQSDDDPLKLVYFLGSILSMELEKEQEILEAQNVLGRTHLLPQ